MPRAIVKYNRNRLLDKKPSSFFEEKTTELAKLRIRRHELSRELREINERMNAIVAKTEYAALTNRSSQEADEYFKLAQEYIEAQ